MAVQAQQHRYDMMLAGLNRILDAADPLNQAQRRYAMMAMPIKQQELEEQAQILKAKADWMRDNPGKPYPGSWGDLVMMQKFNRMQADDGNAKAATTDPGTGGNVPPGRTTPSYYPTLTPTPQPQIFTTKPPTEAPTAEQEKKWGPLPGFGPDSGTTTDTGTTTGTEASTDTDTDITGDVTKI